MRIAFVSLMSGTPWGGSEGLWSSTAERALSEGHEVFVSVYRWPETQVLITRLKKAGAVVSYRDRYDRTEAMRKRILYYAKNKISNYTRVYKTIVQFNPDIIIINQGDSFDLSVHHFPLYKLLKKGNIAYVLICHGHEQYGSIPTDSIYPKACAIFTNAVKVMFVSKRMHSMTERRLCMNIDNGMVIQNTVNLSEKSIVEWPLIDRVSFATVSTLGFGKGLDTLFECLNNMNLNSKEWILNIYGEGYGKGYLEDLASWYGLTGNICFMGHRSDIREIWKHNHVLLIPSIGEGMPISLVEAMICGRPAIATDVGGISEILEDGKSGFLAEAPSVKSFSGTLVKAMKNRQRWEKMGRYAHGSIIERLDPDPAGTLLTQIAECLK